MKLRTVGKILLLSLPLWIGLLLDGLLDLLGITNSILLLQIRIDPGTLVLLFGLLLSALLLGTWLYRRSRQERERLFEEKVHQDASELRRRFVQQLDHELRNPLMGLRAGIGYLSGGQTVENYAQVLEDMSAQIDRVGRLVNDLRRLAEMENLQIDSYPVNLGDVLHEILEAIEDHPEYPQHPVRLVLLNDPLPIPEVLGDRGLLWLACYNLVENALKFTPPGSKIEVRAFESDPWVVVEVIDSGPGIPPNDLDHIFEELYRGVNARGTPGSGLGLALVRAIVAQHQGELAVRSRAGQGTAFTLRLPASTAVTTTAG